MLSLLPHRSSSQSSSPYYELTLEITWLVHTLHLKRSPAGSLAPSMGSCPSPGGAQNQQVSRPLWLSLAPLRITSPGLRTNGLTEQRRAPTPWQYVRTTMMGSGHPYFLEPGNAPWAGRPDCWKPSLPCLHHPGQGWQGGFHFGFFNSS